MITVAVLVPSKGRPQQLMARMTDLLTRPVPDGVQLLVVLSVLYDDNATLGIVDMLQSVTWPPGAELHFTLRTEQDSTAVHGWNRAYLYAQRHKADWFVLGADDIVWHRGWLEEALKVARETGAEVVGLNDGQTDLDHYGPHYMASKRFTEKVLGGVMVPPEYNAWWFDREICETARRMGLYAPAWGSFVEHLHPDWQKAEMDETYTEAWPLHEVDRQTYERRRSLWV